ncbi:MAG: WhiB family transcriptional regulator, partial [Ilumatobacteraceae bacterium]
CRSCSVRRDCAHQGITEPHGIWGGFDQDMLDFLRGYRQPDIVTKQLVDAQLARV